MSKGTIEARKAFTARSFAVSLIYLLSAIVLTTFTWLYTQKGEVVPVFLFPFIYPALLNAIFGSISPRLRLNMAELSLILVVLFFTSGSIGASHLNDAFPDLIDKTIIAVGSALSTEGLAPYFEKWVPEYLFPTDPQIITALRNGLVPGQFIDFGKLVPAIAFWSIYSILYFTWAFFIIFGLCGKQLVDVEKLPFPEFQPFIYVANASVDFKEETTFSNWLHATRPEYKVFWICFFIGFALSFWPLISQFIPVIPVGVLGTQEWGYPDFNIEALAKAIPGAWAHNCVSMEQVALWMTFVPSNSLATMVIMYIITGLIYPVVGIQIGIIPYEPGMEYRWSWEDTPGNWYPWPYEAMFYGSYLAVGVLVLWTVRGRIKSLWNALTGEGEVEDGLPLRLLSIIGAIGFFGLFFLNVAIGVPPLSSFMMIVIVTLGSLSIAKLYGLFWHHSGDPLGFGAQGYWYLPGSLLGYYPSTYGLENANYASFITCTVMTPYYGCWFVRCHGVGPCGLSGLYKFARESMANFKHVLLGGLLLIIIGVPFAYTLYMWMIIHGGGINRTSGWGSWSQWFKYGYAITGYGTGIRGESSYAAPLLWHAIGFILFFALYAIRLKVPKFFWDPFAMAFSWPYLDYIWLPALIALIIRTIAIRVMGATRWLRYGSSIGIGLAWGWVMTMIIGFTIHFTTVILPAFQSYYVP
jgi:hypothetical protein